MKKEQGTIYIVATPIGNLKDITLRALEVLKEVDLIACEDTRQTRKLLERFEVKKETISYHQHSKLTKIDFLLNKVLSGKNLAVVSDAGTPGVSDPGNKLVEEALNKNIKVVPIPGVSSVTTILSVAGFATDRFSFLGFMPHKSKTKVFKEISESKYPVVFLESVHRIVKTLTQLAPHLKAGESKKERQVVIGRELTKVFETIYRGNIEEVLEKLQDDKVKGEFVVVVNK